MKREQPKTIIGRRDKIDFPDLGLYDIDVKIDTGAYTSSIHCHDIKVIHEDGMEKIRFSLLDPLHPFYSDKELTLPICAKTKVKNSFGQVEERYIVKTRILLFGELIDLELSLTDRSKMDYPVLLGRRLLDERFIVDVTQTDLSYKQKLGGNGKMKIAVLSRNEKLYSTKRLVEAVKGRGHEVEVIDFLKCYFVIEKGNPEIYYHGTKLTGIDAVIPRIGASRTFYGTAVVRQFEMMNIFCANESQAITRSRDKLRTMQILSRERIGIPITAFASSPSDVSHLVEEVGGAPLVIKLLQGTQGIGVVLAETKKAAESVIEAFYGVDANMLIQEYIKEAKGADIRAFVVGGEVVGAMKRQGAKGEFRSNIHRGGTATQIKLSDEEKSTAVNAAGVLGLNIAGVDMLQSGRGSLIMEVNSSPGLEGIEKATNIDIAGKIVEFIEKNVHNREMIKDRINV